MPSNRKAKEITKVKTKNQNNSQTKKPTRSKAGQNHIPSSSNTILKSGCNVKEQILDKRKDNEDGFQYLVKWKGRADDKNSWESYKNIFPRSLVAEYEGRKALERQEEFLSGNENKFFEEKVTEV